MAASTQRQCRRSDSEETHSVSRSQASSREISRGMVVTLAQRPGRFERALPPMEKFVIEGGVPLSGSVTPAGNKNAALPILAACLLTEDELVVSNVPRIRDVESMLGLLERLGVNVAWIGENEVRLQADNISGVEVDEELANRIRASFLVAGPLLARCGEVRMPPPGGDTIGRRRLDAHLDAFRDLGAKVAGDLWIELSGPPEGLKPTRIFMDEPSVMGTE